MTTQPVEYRLLTGRVIAPGELEALTAGDWRFLFWLSLEIQRGGSLGTLFDLIADHATPERRRRGSRLDGGAASAQRLIALDMVERATRGAATIAEFHGDGYLTVREAAALRGVSRQAIGHLVRSGKVGFVRRGRLVLIDRRSMSRLRDNSRKRLSGRQILMIPGSVVARRGPGTGILCALDRPLLEHVMVRGDFSYCLLRPGSRLSERDHDMLDTWGVERKGGEAYRDWLEAGARLSTDGADAAPDAAPPLPRILRHAEAWRFRIPPPLAETPILGELLRCGDGRIDCLAVLHYVAVGGWGFLDVSFDAPAAAVESLRRNAEQRRISSQPTADVLRDRPAGSLWCEALAGQFAAALRQAIRGGDGTARRFETPLLDDAVFGQLCGLVESNYPHTLGLVTKNFWIDARQVAALAEESEGRAEAAESRRAAGAATAARRKRIRGAEFERSLSEFHGLGLLVDRLGWSPEMLLERLPRIIDTRRWSLHAAPPEISIAPGADPTPRAPASGI